MLQADKKHEMHCHHLNIKQINYHCQQLLRPTVAPDSLFHQSFVDLPPGGSLALADTTPAGAALVVVVVVEDVVVVITVSPSYKLPLN